MNTMLNEVTNLMGEPSLDNYIFPEPEVTDHEIYQSPKEHYLKLLTHPNDKKEPILITETNANILRCLMHVCVKVIEQQKILSSPETLETARKLQSLLKPVQDGILPSFDQVFHGKSPVSYLKLALDNFIAFEDNRANDFHQIHQSSPTQNIWRIALTGYWEWIIRLKLPKSGKGKYQRFLSIMQGNQEKSSELTPSKINYWLENVWAKKITKKQSNQILEIARTMAEKKTFSDFASK